MNPVEIKLRAKYRNPVHGRMRSSHNDQGSKKTNKIGYERHVAIYGVPPLRVRVLLPSGKVRMETRPPEESRAAA